MDVMDARGWTRRALVARAAAGTAALMLPFPSRRMDSPRWAKMTASG